MIKTICLGVQTPQIRLELKVKMRGLETQVIRAGAKSHTSEESSVSGARGQEREGWGQGKESSRDDKVVGIQTQRLDVSLLLFFLNLHCCHGKPEGENFLRNL